jgi:threonine/homoserine/homoserine lactone efflux protein
MPLVVTRMLSGLRALNDASKLCFGATLGFGIVGGSVWLAAILGSSESRLSGLLWIGLFYLVLGWLEHFKAARSAIRISVQKTSDHLGRYEAIEGRSTTKAA